MSRESARLLLPGCEPSLTDVQVVWLPGTLPARVRLLIDFIAARLSLAGCMLLDCS